MRVFVLVRSLRGDTSVALCVCGTLALAQSSAQRHVEQLAAEAAVPPVQIAWTRVRAPTWLPWWQVEASAWHGAGLPDCDYTITEHELVVEGGATPRA